MAPRQQDILELLRAHDGALCIAVICAAFPASHALTRAALLKMEAAGLVVIEDAGRQKGRPGHSDGSLVTLTAPAAAASPPPRAR